LGVIHKCDSHGKPFRFPTLVLNKTEYAKIVSEINSSYSAYEKDLYTVHCSVNMYNRYCLYYFENHGFNDYNIYRRVFI